MTNTKDSLAEEEQGEIVFVAQCVKSLLQHIGMSKEAAKRYVDAQGPYYSAGQEVVQILALVEGMLDLIFADMNGAM